MCDAGHAAPEVGDDVDDGAGRTALDPGPGRRLHHVPGTIEVVVDHRVPALGLEVERHLRELTTGIVNQRIEPTELVPDVADEGRATCMIADVERLGIDRGAKTFEEHLGPRQPLLTAPQNGEIRAEARKQRGDRKAKAAAGAGDDGNLALAQVGAIDGWFAAELFVRQAEVLRTLQGHGCRLSLRLLRVERSLACSTAARPTFAPVRHWRRSLVGGAWLGTGCRRLGLGRYGPLLLMRTCVPSTRPSGGLMITLSSLLSPAAISISRPRSRAILTALSTTLSPSATVATRKPS